jgi:dihydrofolate synthase/folylpolyglutamate synthase
MSLLGRDFWFEYPPNGKPKPRISVPLSDLAMSYVERDLLTEKETRYDDIKLNLLGRHQAANASLAIAVASQLNTLGFSIGDDVIRRGLANVSCPARVEIVSRKPLVVIDAAHNVASVCALVETINSNFNYKKSVLIFATSRDKDCDGMLRELLPNFDLVILTRFVDNPRALSLDRLATIGRSCAAELANRHELSKCDMQVCDSPASSWHAARSAATDNDLICICGSSFIAGEVRRIVHPREAINCPDQHATVSSR